MANDIQVFRDLHDAVSKAVGVRLFTISAMNMQEAVARRAYTSHPIDYPNTGVKEIFADEWTEHVMKGGRELYRQHYGRICPLFSRSRSDQRARLPFRDEHTGL